MISKKAKISHLLRASLRAFRHIEHVMRGRNIDDEIKGNQISDIINYAWLLKDHFPKVL